jgi:hypothetical protein
MEFNNKLKPAAKQPSWPLEYTTSELMKRRKENSLSEKDGSLRAYNVMMFTKAKQRNDAKKGNNK